MKWIAGADPGKNGAIVLLNAEANAFGKDDVICFPTKVDKYGRVDVEKIYENLKPYLKDIVMYIQEDIHSIFGTSAGSNFSFGDANGSLRSAVFVALKSAGNNDYKFALVQPKVWQKLAWRNDEIIREVWMDAKTKQPKTKPSGENKMKICTKETSMNAAHRIFPETSFVMPRCRTEHDGCVDAALIAYYGREVYIMCQD